MFENQPDIDSFVRVFRKSFAVLLFVFALNLFATAQIVDVKNDPDYIFGVGTGETLEAADNAALQNLVSKISVSIESSYSNIEKEISEGGSLSSSSAVESVLRTYSNTPFLKNVEQVVEQEVKHDDYSFYQVCRYMKRSEVTKIFEGRRNKVVSMLDLAFEAEKNSEIDVALQQYYWAFCLLKSLPDANGFTNDRGELLITWIPAQINSILKSITAEKQKKVNNDVYISIKYKDYPIARLDYTYFDGKHQSPMTNAIDGNGIMEMAPGASTEKLKINCEYEYESYANIDDEIATVVRMMKNKPFPAAVIPVTGKFKTGKDEEDADFSLNLAEQASILEEEVTLSVINEQDDLYPYEKVMSAVVKAIRAKSYESASQYFTENGQDMYRKLLKYGNARIIAEPDFTYIRFGDEVICRSLKMCFAFKNNTRKFLENVNFTFNGEGKIDCIAFGLGEEAANSILLHKAYSETARIVLTQFLENYKTAFALKRLDYIESIFDDNAIIITGTVVKRSNYSNKDQKRYFDNKIIRENRFTKTQYMEKLRKCFNSNEFVNIRFAQNDIVKGGSELGEVYGIQIKQDYYSSTYGDTGYLFLYVDFNTPDKPLIKVRTWQPERDPDFGVYGLGHF